MERPILALAFAGILGVIFAVNYISAPTLIILLVIVGILIYREIKNDHINYKFLLSLLVMFVVFGVRTRYADFLYSSYDKTIASFEDMDIKVEGRLEKTGMSDNSIYYVLGDSTISSAYGNYDLLSDDNKIKYAHKYNQPIGKVKIYIKKDFLEDPIYQNLKLYIGNRISFTCYVSQSDYPTNDGEFDFKTYNRGIFITEAFYSESLPLVIDDTRDHFANFIQEIKNKINEKIFLLYNDEDAGLLSAMTTGDKSNLSQKIRKMFSDSGISHILAISGLHLSILGLGLFELLRKKISIRTSAIVTTIFIIFYGILIDASATSVRAIFMLLLRFISLSIGRTYDTKNALALAAIMLLFYNPYVLFNAGFQFSFIAIYSLNLYDTSNINNKILKIIIPSIVLQLFILPITIFHYFKYPTYSILLNFIVIPLMVYVLCIGLLSIAFSFIFIPCAYFLAGSVHYIFMFYRFLITVDQRLPLYKITLGRPSYMQIVIYYLILVILLSIDSIRADRLIKSIRDNKLSKLKIYSLASKYFACSLILIVFLTYKFNPNLEVNYLNIGQGDAIVVKNNDILITIDGGSTSNKSNGKYILEPFILSHAKNYIDIAFITHADSDHTNGIKYILDSSDEINIGSLILPVSAINDYRYNDIINSAISKNCNIRYMKMGDEVILNDDIKISCLYPIDNSFIENANAHSLILLLEKENSKFLFMGDAGINEEMAMIDNSKYMNKDVRGSILKAGHHGSSTSSGKEFIECVAPQLVILSYGKNNQYGHPHTEVLEILEGNGIPVLTTAASGQITIDGQNKITTKYINNVMH